MTHIKLMIDTTFGKPVADALKVIGVVKVMTTIEYGFRYNAGDSEIIRKIKKDKYLLFTHDGSTINERRYHPCTHAGIIIFEGIWSEEKIVERMKTFCQSGHKKLAPRCVTHLYEEKAIIYRHGEEVIEVPFK